MALPDVWFRPTADKKKDTNTTFRPTRNPDETRSVYNTPYVPPLPTVQSPTSSFFGGDGVPDSIRNPDTTALVQRAAREAEMRRRAAEYAKRYGIGRMARLDAGRKARGGIIEEFVENPIDTLRIAAREGISYAEAERRVKRARELTSGLKAQYRNQGLYFGDMSGDYDPLLKNAGQVETTAFKFGTESEQFAQSTRAFQNRAARLDRLRRLALERRAQQAAESIANPDDKTTLGKFLKGNDSLLRALGNAPTDNPQFRLLQAVRDQAENGIEDPAQFLAMVSALRQMAQANAAKDTGFVSDIKGAVGDLADAAGYLQEEVFLQPYYAATRARDKGEGTGSQVRAFLSGFPGLGSTGDKDSRRYARETSSREERQTLRDEENLRSFGENVFGDTKVGGKRLSGLGDAAFQIIADPLNSLTGVFKAFSSVGRYAGEAGARAAAREAGLGLFRRNFSDMGGLIARTVKQGTKGMDEATAKAVGEQITQNIVDRAAQARGNYLANTATGRALMDGAAKVADTGMDAAAVRKAVPGLSEQTALEVASAASRADAVEALRRAFVSGEWDPTVTLRRQALAKASGRGIAAPSGIGLGGRVVRTSDGLFDFAGRARTRVRGAEIRTVTKSSNIRALSYNTLRAGLARAGARIEDVYSAHVAPHVVGLNVEERLGRAWDQVEGQAGLEDLFEQGLRVAEKTALESMGVSLKTATVADVARVANSAEMQEWLKQMETIAALASGDVGKEAAEQVAREAKFTLSRKFQADQKLLNQALANSGVRPSLTGIGNPTPKSAQGVRFLQAKIANAFGNGVIDANARDALMREVDRTAGLKSNKFKALEQRIETVFTSPDAAREFERLLANRGELFGAVEEALTPAGLGRRLTNIPVKLVNSILEPVAPSKVSFLGYGNDAYAIQARVEGIDRWAADLGVDDFTRTVLRQSAERVVAEDDLFKLVHQTLAQVGERAGMDAAHLAKLRELVEGDLVAIKTGRKKVTDVAMLADGTVKTVDEVQLLAQRGEVVYLPDPEDVKRTIREWKAAKEGLFTHPLQKGRVGLAKVADANILGLKGMVIGTDLSARYVFEQIHRKWKYLTVVPGLELATMGAAVGFAMSEGDTGDRLKGALQGASVGLISPLRYIVRVGGVEEGLRKYLAEGFNVEAFKPHLSKFATQRGLDRPFTLHNAVKAGDPIGMQSHRLLETAEREWTALGLGKRNPIAKLGRKETRYLDGYARIIDYQIHPETDPVADILLRRQAGEITPDEAVQMFTQFAASDAGALWLRRLKGAYGGPKSFDEAFARYSDFIGKHAADPEVAAARLDAAREFARTGTKHNVDRSILKDAARRSGTPEYIHAEKTFVVPKNFKQIAEFRSRMTSKFAFEGPTTAMNRVPMAKAIYRDEYERLIANGVSPERAQSIAEQVAVNRTNKVMFRIDDESRFAAKSDYVFPFQQPREELLRVWAPLIAKNPARALHVTNVIATAFNNGQESGLFYEDQYGNWRMAVPGSAWLSQKLFGFPQAFDFSVKDLVFFGQGAYGVNIIPSPGGPYWTAATRLFLNRNPEWYENLSSFQKEWFFPYGSTGRLFRPEVSRLWQAWTGEPAPFEFASRKEQEDALERHRIEVFLQLKYQHALATAKVKGDWTTGDLDWEPSEEELDEATSASLKAWAFVGAFFPAGPQKVRPDLKAFQAITSEFTDAAGELDFAALSDAYPGVEPWLVGMTEARDDGSFDDWARQYQRTDKMLHIRSTKSFNKWHSEMKERQRESKAYAERSEIYNYPPAMRADLYDAWDQKYPDLAQNRVDNYERDIDLMHIEGTLTGQAKEDALNAWRKRYDVSFGTYRALAAKLRDGQLRTEFDPWSMARTTSSVVADVERQLSRTTYGAGKASGDFEARYAAEQRIVATLPVAEQIKYWQHRVNNMDYDWSDDPQLLLDRFYAVKGNLSALWKSPPMALDRAMKHPSQDSPWAKAIAKKSQDYRESISAAYAEAARLDAEIDKLADKGLWYTSEYKALKERRNALYDSATAMKNEWYKGDFDVMGALDDLKAVMVFAAKGDTKAIQRITKWRQENGWFIPSDEQSAYLNMNSDMKQAYIDKLVDGLSIQSEPGEFKEGKLFWEWLTEFQQDLLSNNLPSWKTQDWQSQSPADSTGKRKSGGYYGGRGYSGRGSSVAQDELSYAYAMFKKYNQRGGAKAPAAYKEYLALPNDAALRSAFLRQHPEVRDYIKLGPMANMPPALAMIVADIMIRNGKWEGESRSMEEITEIAFAREMMERWNRRGEKQAPAALQAWLQMPTGVEKANYLKAHPEIGEWLQLGPMSNMPEMYREVVRDIMFRYGMWSDNQDPLGKTISEYYSTPSYARDKFLEAHPELTEYWKLTRSPEEQANYALADQYFSIGDPNTKRAFLQMHPELGEWFLNQRQKRYEKFLNQVAIYMGSNPEMFEQYLQRQEDILSDILHKFSDVPVMRERFIMRDSRATERGKARSSA